MYQYPAEFNEFTEDDFERQELRASYIEPTSLTDQYGVEVEQIATQLAFLSRGIPQKHRKAIEMYHRGKTKAEITRETGICYQTIQTALNSAKGLRLQSLMTQLSELKGGPSLEARRAMMWRIAMRAEQIAPNVALKALDTLEKQAGTYRPEVVQAEDTGLVVHTANFIVDNSTHNITLADNPSNEPVYEGEFVHVEVEIERKIPDSA